MTLDLEKSQTSFNLGGGGGLRKTRDLRKRTLGAELQLFKWEWV